MIFIDAEVVMPAGFAEYLRIGETLLLIDRESKQTQETASLIVRLGSDYNVITVDRKMSPR
jgi:hypothetical protein